MNLVKPAEVEENSSNYTSTKYVTPDGAPSDVAIFTIDFEEKEPQELPLTDVKILMIKRKKWPYKGSWALPGGFSDPQETLLDAAKRELREETTIDGLHVEHLDVYSGLLENGEPRDPRGWIISSAYYALVNEDNLKDRKPADDAEEAELLSLRDVLSMKRGNKDGTTEENEGTLGFDHNKIIKDAYQKVQEKVLQTNIAKEFLPKEFTLAELYQVIQTIVPSFEEEIHSNFKRKVLQRRIIEEVAGKTSNKHSKRHAQLYRFTGHVPQISIYSSWS
jgi:8-oxo-dGTP diphosphatase